MDDKNLPAILVVEDEVLIRMDAVDMIEEAGFRVYEAGSADAAIALMEKHPDIGILFTDIDMPGTMDGLKLAAYVRDRWPPVAIIIASGVVGVEQAAMPDGSSFFPKPYATNQITETLHQIAARMR